MRSRISSTSQVASPAGRKLDMHLGDIPLEQLALDRSEEVFPPCILPFASCLAFSGVELSIWDLGILFSVDPFWATPFVRKREWRTTIRSDRPAGGSTSCVLVPVNPIYLIPFFSCFCWYMRPSAWAINSLTVMGASGS